jgi:hypothetical protein
MRGRLERGCVKEWVRERERESQRESEREVCVSREEVELYNDMFSLSTGNSRRVCVFVFI